MQLTRKTYPTEEMQRDAIEVKEKVLKRMNPNHLNYVLFGEREHGN